MGDPDNHIAGGDASADGALLSPAARRLGVQYAVSLVLAESPDLGDAAPRLLGAIGEGLDWQIGAFWRVDARAGVLRCDDTWQAPGLINGEFERATREIAFPAGIGLPGRAWASGEPVWVSDVLGDDNFPRLGAAAAEGLHGAIAFPVRGSSEILGVVEFFNSALQPPDTELIRALAALGNQIGQFIERKQAEDAMRASEARTRAILEAGLDAIITIDQEGRVVDFNPAAETLFGYSRDTAVGQPISDLIIPPSLRRAHVEGLARYLVTGEGRLIGQRVETTAMRADGAEFPVELAITRIQVDGPPMFTGQIRDLTERKRIDQIMSMASHDLRAPLTNILGRADLVEMRLNKGGPLNESWLRTQLEALRGSARRMLSTVEEIADTARLHSGRALDLRKTVVDLGEMARAVAAESAARRDAAPIIAQAPAGVMVEGDRVRLERVPQNLIDNAVKYSPKEAPIHVEVSAQNQWALVTVRDQGVGIPAAELPQIFTPFYRASTASGIAGTGLGLASAKAIVEQHGGQIAVESAVGHGTTVTVRLPRLPMPGA